MSKQTYTVIAIEDRELQRDLQICHSLEQAIGMANTMLEAQMRENGHEMTLTDDDDDEWGYAGEGSLHAWSNYGPVYDVFIVNDETDVTYVYDMSETSESDQEPASATNKKIKTETVQLKLDKRFYRITARDKLG